MKKPRLIVAALVVGFLGLLVASAFVIVLPVIRYFDLPDCVPSEPVLAQAVAASDVDWRELNGFEPTQDSPSDLRGQRGGTQVRQTCEFKSYGWHTEESFQLGAFDILTIHRMPDGVVADEWFPKFQTGRLHHDIEVSAEHRESTDRNDITAHHLPGSCLIVTVRWSQYAETPEVPRGDRHPIIRDLLEQLAPQTCDAQLD